MPCSGQIGRYGCHPGMAATPSAARHGAGDLAPPDAIREAFQQQQAGIEGAADTVPAANGEAAAAAAPEGDAAPAQAADVAAPAGAEGAPAVSAAEGESGEAKPEEEFGHGLLVSAASCARAIFLLS